MTTETFYYCDYCGEKFDNKYDCITHEKNHKAIFANGIRFFYLEDNGELRELPKDTKNIGSTLDKANLVFCKDADSWDALSDIFDDKGYCPPSDYCGYISQFYAWDADICVWYDAGERVEKLTAALDIIKTLAVGE